MFFRIFVHKPFSAFIENPLNDIKEPYLLLKGFIITNNKDPFQDFALYDDGTRSKVEIFSSDRYDVKRNFRFQNSIAFVSPPTIIDDRSELRYRLTFKIGNRSYEYPLSFKNSGNVETFRKMKFEKLKKIAEILECPKTKSTDLQFENEKILVSGKDLGYRYNALKYDFLPEEIAGSIDAAPPENISQMDYFDSQNALASKLREGLVLDHGCGLKVNYHPSVVYYDIADYPTTDVRGTAEELPFQDGVFDAVISHAVFEHVRDPFKCAREIIRVMKPDGILQIAVAFLQPLHGYPNHYYNMTLPGLLNLFGEKIDVSGIEIGHPFYALSWIINSYLKGLPQSEQRKFLNSRIRDFELEDEIMNRSFAGKVSESTKKELATWVTINARKVQH
jgi:SAM-dependent methyltransferase